MRTTEFGGWIRHGVAGSTLTWGVLVGQMMSLVISHRLYERSLEVKSVCHLFLRVLCSCEVLKRTDAGLGLLVILPIRHSAQFL